MFRSATFLILILFCVCTQQKDYEDGNDHGHENHETEWMAFLEEENISEDERKKWIEYLRREHDHEREEDTFPLSWKEALGYEECEEFEGNLQRHRHGDHTGHHHRQHKKHHHGHHKEHHPDHHEKHHHGHHGHHDSRHDGHHEDHHNNHDESDHPDSAANCDIDGESGVDRHHRKLSVKPKSIDDICENQSECPNFVDIEHNNCGYGARKIAGAKWVQTKIDVDNLQGWMMKSLFRLFRYINGHNTNKNGNKVEMDMTTPVLSLWCYDLENKLVSATVSYYIPLAHQVDPPTPTDSENVSIVEWEDMVVYNRAFGGRHPDKTDYDEQFEKLRDALDSAGVAVRTDTKITAGFTHPHDRRQRYEVMLLGTDEEPLAA